MHCMISVGRRGVLLAVLGVLLVWTGYASAAPPSNVKSVNCAAAQIDWDVAAEAEIVEFGCDMGKSAGEDSLIFSVVLKNTSQSPSRFRLQIWLLDMDKAAGSLVPAKGKPPVVAPGATETVKIPFMKTTTMARKVQVRVVPMSAE